MATSTLLSPSTTPAVQVASIIPRWQQLLQFLAKRISKLALMALPQPKIYARIDCSPFLSLSGGAFSISVSAYVSDTDDQTLTIYMPCTLLDPLNRPFEAHGFTFTDVETEELVARPLVNYLNGYPTSECQVQPGSAPNFAELYPEIGPASYRTVFSIERDGYAGPRNGFVAGRTYRIGLGTESNKIAWWKVGPRQWALQDGEAKKEHVNTVVGDRSEMFITGQAMFQVVE
ncbi:hypothetical protein N0V90_013362 [Kalmusia sp. IMI 367209]|nr:hypothetical protein N0V90_013362 [Kalmusia sp. IMI 367209]